EPKSNQAIEENYKAEITFNKPTYTVSLDSAFTYYDSLFIDQFTQEELTWNKHHNILKINKKLDRSILARIKATKDSIELQQKNIEIDTVTSSETELEPIDPEANEINEEEAARSPRLNRTA